MMQTLFTAIIKMSAAASIICLVMYLIKPITAKIFSSAWHFYTKLIIVLILLIPFHLRFTSLELSIPDEYSNFFKFNTISTQPETNDFMESSIKSPGLPGMQSMEQTLTASARPIIVKFFPFIQYIWLCGVIIFIMLKLKSYIMFKKIMMRNIEIEIGEAFDMLNLRRAEMDIKREIRLVSNDAVGTPMLVGLFKPAIIIPDVGIQQNELWFIFTHELIHYKRGDLWIKTLVLIANALHWFNPVFPPLVRSINCLCELSCDEAVIKKLDLPSRKQYAETILCTIDRKIAAAGVVYSAMNEHADNLKRRLTNMLNYKKPQKIKFLLSITIAVIIFTIGITVSTAAMGNPANNADVHTEIPESVNPEQVIAGNTSKQDNSNKEQEGTSMVWPVPDSNSISARYGIRTHPISKLKQMHNGIDIGGNKGDPIVAAEKGTVVIAGWKSVHGNTIIIRHSNGIETLYAHCSKLLVQKGDKISAGQEIALIGDSGTATGPHLHFEVSRDGETQNPTDYASAPKDPESK